MKPNMVLVAAAGSFGQMLEMSPKSRVYVLTMSAEAVSVMQIGRECVNLFDKYFSRRKVMEISNGMMPMLTDFYIKIRNVLASEDFLFRQQAVEGYLKVLSAYGCQWITDYYAANPAKESDTVGDQRIFEGSSTL